MIKHMIQVRHVGVPKPARLSVNLIKHSISGTLQCEGADIPCEVSVLVTNNAKIREMNREFRGIDEATDVLSFPMQKGASPGWRFRPPYELDPDTGFFPLGDIVLSANMVRLQAYDTAQTVEDETAYLTVHSVLHLLGYDHVDEADGKKRMRMREKSIMREMFLLYV